jgi:hypothetical protein
MAMSTNRARNLFNSLQGKLSEDFSIVEIFIDEDEDSVFAKLNEYPEWTLRDFAIAREIGVTLGDGLMFCSTNLV